MKDTMEIYSGQGHNGKKKAHVEYDPVLPLSTNTWLHIPIVGAQNAFQKVHHKVNPLVTGSVTHSCYCPLSFHHTL